MNELLIRLRGDKPRSVVAQDLGITSQGLGMIERGKRVPRYKLMKKIADYYGKTVDDIFFTQQRHELCHVNIGHKAG